jgi:hypothetical protein
MNLPAWSIELNFPAHYGLDDPAGAPDPDAVTGDATIIR